MMKKKETLKDYGIDDIQLEKALYQMLIDQGLDDDGIIHEIIDDILSHIYN